MSVLICCASKVQEPEDYGKKKEKKREPPPSPKTLGMLDIRDAFKRPRRQGQNFGPANESKGSLATRKGTKGDARRDLEGGDESPTEEQRHSSGPCITGARGCNSIVEVTSDEIVVVSEMEVEVVAHEATNAQVLCPICAAAVTAATINDHLDTCLE